MRSFVVLMLAGVASAAIFSPKIPAIPKEMFLDDMQTEQEPIDEMIGSFGSITCSDIKKLIGIEYEQINEQREPDMDKLSLELRTNGSRTIYEISAAADAIPKSKHVNWNNKLVIFIHGFTDSPSLFAFKTISESFLNEGKTVLALDCSPFIRWLYLRSTTYVRFIGEKLGSVLARMVQNGVNPEDIHLVGHSLGAQISGFAGKTFHKLTNMKVGRISGLDPAGPCFSDVDPDLRLLKTDADFVDVIHTNGGVYGLTEPLGHVDFYPNGGSKQHKCLTQICNHCRAWVYYAESVTNPKAFPAVQCDSWEQFKKKQCTKVISYMGYPTKPVTRGRYYLMTAQESPYGLGEKGLTYSSRGIFDKIIDRVVRGPTNYDNEISEAESQTSDDQTED